VNLVVLLVLSQFATDVFDNPTPFEEVETKDGVKVSRREVKGSPYSENRIELATPYTPKDLCDAVYEWGTHKNDGPAVMLHKVVSDGENVRVVYNQITQPVVSNRDYSLTIVRSYLDDGKCRIRFRATNEHAPPKPDGFVRMNKVWGEWIFEPLSDGGGKVTYTLFSDPAGAVPPFLVHGAARGAAREAALLGVQKAKQALEARK